MTRPQLPAFLEAAYERFNRPEYISPDPLELVLGYADPDDREVAGLLASCLATGNVKAILAGAREALGRLGDSPARGIDRMGPARLSALFADFRYRFFSGGDIAALLSGAARLRAAYGYLGRRIASLNAAHPGPDILGAYQAFVEELRHAAGRPFKKALLPCPEDGSACKRPMLWLRWMARRDAVDPGPWERGLEPLLVLPLDTHMERVGRSLGLLKARSGGLKLARELTESFRKIKPDDPARYDFALTRPGINRCLETGPDFECLRPEAQGAAERPRRRAMD